MKRENEKIIEISKNQMTTVNGFQDYSISDILNALEECILKRMNYCNSILEVSKLLKDKIDSTPKIDFESLLNGFRRYNMLDIDRGNIISNELDFYEKDINFFVNNFLVNDCDSLMGWYDNMLKEIKTTKIKYGIEDERKINETVK